MMKSVTTCTGCTHVADVVSGLRSPLPGTSCKPNPSLLHPCQRPSQPLLHSSPLHHPQAHKSWLCGIPHWRCSTAGRLCRSQARCAGKGRYPQRARPSPDTLSRSLRRTGKRSFQGSLTFARAGCIQRGNLLGSRGCWAWCHSLREWQDRHSLHCKVSRHTVEGWLQAPACICMT